MDQGEAFMDLSGGSTVLQRSPVQLLQESRYLGLVWGERCRVPKLALF